jgi:O-antigen ligase
MDRLLSWMSFGLVTLAALASPWFFGAWVPWWFWPFAGCLFLAVLVSGLRLIAHNLSRQIQSPGADIAVDADGNWRSLAASRRWICAAVAVTLVYVFIRCLQAPVRMDAERSFLLFLLPVAIAAQVALMFDARQRRWLLRLLAANFLLLGLYGIANHWFTGSRLVLWEPGYEQYQVGTDRATGSYFCPNHFAGIMELGFALGLALLMARGHGWRWRMAGGLVGAVAAVAIVMSKSRGAGFVVLAMVMAAVAVGFYQRSVLKRWCWRVGALAAVAIIAGLAWHAEPGYVKRFKSYFLEGPVVGATWREKTAAIRNRLESSDRYQMISAALRGWKMAPVVGIGPGMHQHYWPHTAASEDGDRASNRWPTYLNSNYHSYEAHSDWAQLLEEFGAIGFLLVVASAGLIAAVLVRDLRTEGRRWRRYGKRDVACVGVDPYAVPLAGLLALVAMLVHSLGDFNLQMPATGWVLAAMVAIPLARDGRTETA